MHARRRLVAADRHFFRVLVRPEFVLDVFGEVDEHRPRLARAGDVKGLFDDAAEVLAPAHGHRVFADAAADADDVHLLKGVVADEVRGHLPREADEGHAVVIGGGDARNEVGRARPAGDQAHARFARGARIAVRRVHQALFVAGQNDAESRFAVERVEQVDRHAARIGEQRIHALFDEGLDKELRSLDLHTRYLLLCAAERGGPARKSKNAPDGALPSGAIKTDRVTTRLRGTSPRTLPEKNVSGSR